MNSWSEVISMDADETQKELLSQSEKWFKKAVSLEIYPVDSKGEEFAENIAAYINDSKHFIDKMDYVRSFEAIVWAWAWIEIGKDIGVISIKDINEKV